MVILHKWTQRDAARAYGIPRRLLFERLRHNATYKKSRSPFAMSSSCIGNLGNFSSGSVAKSKPYSMDDIQEAMRLISEARLPQSIVARKFGIPRTTLNDRMRKLNILSKDNSEADSKGLDEQQATDAADGDSNMEDAANKKVRDNHFMKCCNGKCTSLVCYYYFYYCLGKGWSC